MTRNKMLNAKKYQNPSNFVVICCWGRSLARKTHIKIYCLHFFRNNLCQPKSREKYADPLLLKEFIQALPKHVMSTNSLARVSMVFPGKDSWDSVNFLRIGPIMRIHLKEYDDISYDDIFNRYVSAFYMTQEKYLKRKDFFPGTFVKHRDSEKYGGSEIYGHGQFETVELWDICFIDNYFKEKPTTLASAGEYILFVHKSLKTELSKEIDTVLDGYLCWIKNNEGTEDEKESDKISDGEQKVKRQKKSESE